PYPYPYPSPNPLVLQVEEAKLLDDIGQASMPTVGSLTSKREGKRKGSRIRHIA
ncbi:unnamed protein product, partial [Choristocarpus tenellus]